MENKYICQLRDLVVDCLKNENVKIILFGSRARGDNSVSSDVDIGIMPHQKIDEGKISLLRERIENSNIPYKVEIVNFISVSKDFKQEALKNIIVWKD